MRTILALLLTVCSCLGQAFSMRDPAFMGQQYIAPVSSGYNPTNNSDGIAPTVWLIADDLSSTPVATWTDHTTNQWSSLTASGSQRPTLVTGNLNGHNTITFDGSAQYLKWVQYYAPQPCEFVAVMSITNNGIKYWISVTNATTFVFYANGGNAIGMHFGGATANGVIPTNQFVVYDILAAGAHSRVFTNNVAPTIEVNAGTNARNGISIGADGGGSLFGNISVAEVLFYSQTNTTVQRSNLWYYLKTKYGTP